jgi:uncharacterized protein DUF6897
MKSDRDRNTCPEPGDNMQEFLAKMTGKKVDVYCGGASSLRGEIVMVEEGVLHLKDDDHKMCFVAIDKIVAVWAARDEDHRAGFVPASSSEK